MIKKLIHRILLYIYYKIAFRKRLLFFASSRIVKGSLFEGANKVYPHAYFWGNMGYGSYIGPNSYIIGNIGRFTSIATNVTCNLGFHPMHEPYATTCPMFFSLKKQNGYTFASKQMFNEMKSPISIGNDCWIGQNVFIVGGININDGAVVLAGAVVTKDVPPYAVVGGVPARVVKYRYDEDTIKFLLDLKWWNFPLKWLESHWTLLCDVYELKHLYSK